MSRNSDNTLIYYPVNTWDVAKVTRKGSGDVGVLCGSNQMINKWAKYKPVILPNVIDTTYDLKGGTGSDKNEWKTTATWWKANDGKCGLTINKYNLASTMIGAWNNNWVYNPPTGGMAAPFRLIDFNYYYHNAVQFAFVTLIAQETEDDYVLNFASNGITLGVQMELRYNENALSIMDFKTALFTDFVDFYFGVVVVNANTEYTFKMNPTKFSASELNPESADSWTRLIELDSNYLPNTSGGTISKIYPVLIPDGTWNQTHSSQTTSDFGGTMVPLPCSPLVTKSASVLSRLDRYFTSYSATKKKSSGADAGITPSFTFTMANNWTTIPINVNGAARFYWLDGKTVTSHVEGEEYLGTDKGTFRIVQLYQYTNNYLNASLSITITHGNSAQITFSNFSNYYNPPVEFILEKDGVLDNYPDGIRFAIVLPNNLGTYATDAFSIS